MSRIYRTLGTVAMTPKGEYDSSAYYEKLNIVDYQGSSYVAKQDVHDVLPTNDTYWLYLGGGVKIIDTLYVFDTVADMKASTKLKNGFTAQTLGYYSINDGGGATYKITDIESETEYQETVGSLYATLIINDSINVKQFGAYGNGINDDTDALSKAINYAQGKNILLCFENDKTYCVNSNVISYDTGIFNIYNSIKINGNNSTIYDKRDHISFGSTFTSVFTIHETSNVEINNLKYYHDFMNIDRSTLGSVGFAFIHCFGDCHNLKINVSAENCRYIVTNGLFSNPTSCGNYGVQDSNIKVTGKNIGYGVALYTCKNVDILCELDTFHRLTYISGGKNINILSSGNSDIPTQVANLITNWYNNYNNMDKVVGCENININTEIYNSTIASGSELFACGIQTYQNELTENRETTFMNINFNVKLDNTCSGYIGGLTFITRLIKTNYINISLSGYSKTNLSLPFTRITLSTITSSSTITNLKFKDIICDGQMYIGGVTTNYIFDNCEIATLQIIDDIEETLFLKNSNINNINGQTTNKSNLIIDNCITNTIEQNAFKYINTRDTIKGGPTTNRPTSFNSTSSLSTPKLYYDTTLHALIIKDGNYWYKLADRGSSV